MPDLHVSEFLALLKKSGLLTTQQWETAQSIARSVRKVSAADVQVSDSAATAAAELVKQSLLTEWQAGQLLKGQTGFVLQQYRLLSPVGKGGMGHVFRASDDRSGAIVAIKVMSRRLSGNQTLVHRFRREIRASSQLNSPHIVKTLDAGCVGKVDFMVMEYVNGDQLDHVAARVPVVPVPIACDVIRQAAVGLQHAHEQKMVHRDIKPANLIVDWSAEGRGTVKIMDMGLVRLGEESEKQTAVTKAGQVMGTPDYMSPEQGWDTATVDIRSDIYSLGCTFFRLLTGRVPFPGDNPLQVLMARCSKDAPSAKSLRPDIPDAIDAVLRKMTLRDPKGRFQTPQEVFDALTPFASPLTVEGLRRALREAGADDAVVLEPAGLSECAIAQDAGYQQFLREMDDGAAVDLMTTTSAGEDQALSPTLPILPQLDRSTAHSRRTVATADRTPGIIAVSAVCVLIALMALILFMNRADEKLPTRSAPIADVPKVVAPNADLATVPPIGVKAGQTLSWQPIFEGEGPGAPATGQLVFRLGSETPANVEINHETGSVHWNVPTEQTPGEYLIRIELLFVHAGKRNLITSTTLSAIVDKALTAYSVNQPDSQWAKPAETVRVSLETQPVVEDGTVAQFRLGSGTQPGMTIDPQSGLFSWTPMAEQTGVHTVTAELTDRDSTQVLANTQLRIFVISMPEFPEQRAQAGELFQIELPKPPTGMPEQLVQLLVAEGCPPGITIDQQASQLKWIVPADASGKHEIRLRPALVHSDLQPRPDLAPESIIVVNVTPAALASMIPLESEVEAAEAELRDLFRREIAAARTAVDRAALAKQLLERSYDQIPGASDYALLGVIEELADRGRALDVALEVNKIRSDRYQTDELAAARIAVAEFRAASLNARQQDASIEHCLRLASLAAAEKQFADVVSFLTPPDVLLRKSDKDTLAGKLADDVARARSLAEELSGDDEAAADIKMQELDRLLQRWQFADLFAANESFSYVLASKGTKSIPDNGRSLWKFEDGRIRLESGSQPFGAGFIDTGSEPGRYLIRMQLSARTTSALLIFGAGRQQNLSAYLLTLDSSAFGRISLAPGLATVASPPAGTSLPATGWNDVEILVDGPLVALRLNGTAVLDTSVTSLKPGRLGILVSLERAVPAPVFDMREPRILLLPE